VRVLSLNLWGMRGEWEARRSVLVPGLRELEPDLVAFVEAIQTDGYDQVVDLVGSGYHVAHQQAREADGQGVSIASRWPIGDVHEVDLHVTPRTSDFACTTVVAEIEAPGPFAPLVFASHLPSWQLQFERERELQAVAAARFLDELVPDRDAHVVLACDLSSDPDAANVRFITGRQSLERASVCYRDAWESVHPDERGETSKAENPLVADWDWPFKRLDYVFVRCGDHGGPTLEITACARIFDQPADGVWASDHFGVWADLEPPRRR
jgi:endonuclease/exonuclease/phosphatase family metal-dependent hydrolase